MLTTFPAYHSMVLNDNCFFRRIYLGFQRSVLAKLDIMIEKQSEVLSILQVLLSDRNGVGGHDILEDVLPKAIASPNELEEMSARLLDKDFKKKMVGNVYPRPSQSQGYSTKTKCMF